MTLEPVTVCGLFPDACDENQSEASKLLSGPSTASPLWLSDSLSSASPTFTIELWTLPRLHFSSLTTPGQSLTQLHLMKENAFTLKVTHYEETQRK